MTPTRPLIRYHGGKWMLAPWILEHAPVRRRYVEPFGGGGSVLMRKPRDFSEVYNDLDKEIVTLFKVVRDRGEELQEKLRLTPFAREEFNEAWTPAVDEMEVARRAVVRSFMGFGSAAITESRPNGRRMTGFRAMSDRSGTTPAADWLNYPDCLPAMVERLQGVVIENRPALQVIERHDAEDTWFYVDPPYVMSTRKDADSDYRHEMTDDDHRQLAQALNRCSGKVMVSGYHSELYDELFRDWFRVERQALADGAQKRTEVLWMNYEREGLLF